MRKRLSLATVAAYVILTLWAFVVIVPLWLTVLNSFKTQREIFRDPFGLPLNPTIQGYTSVWTDGRFDLYFLNSTIIALTSLGLILFFGSLAAYALAQWHSRASRIIFLFFIAGLMIPIRIGTINLIQLLQSFNLLDSLGGLIAVYVATGLPIAVFVLTEFIRTIPVELQDAARVDGASEFRIYRSLVLPLTRPALATVAVFNLIPIWNDLWFPLIFIRSEEFRTVTLGVSLLVGQYNTDWNRMLSVLTLGALPVLIAYLLMSRQFIRGLTAGALKG
jgi:raffinose/stachyose/melibiose transport system permease protein